MGLDDIITSGAGAAARSSRPQQDAETDENKPNAFLDVAASPFRGVEGAVQGIYDLADYATGDVLPDYDTRFLGRSSTVVGGLGEGIANFLTGFIPIAGWLGKAGQVTRAGRLLGKGTAGMLARGKPLNREALRALSKQKAKVAQAAKFITAGAASDFLVFDGQEERLSNLLYQFPALQNPVTEFLKEDDDNEIEGRLKNVVEGLFIEAGVAGLIAPFIKGIKTLKARGKAAGRGLDKVDATEEAIERSTLTETDLDLAVDRKTAPGSPLHGIKGGSEQDVETWLKQQDLTLEDFIYDPKTGTVAYKEMGAGGRSPTRRELNEYGEKSWREKRKSGEIIRLDAADAAGISLKGLTLGEVVDRLLIPKGEKGSILGRSGEKTDEYLSLLKDLKEKHPEAFKKVTVSHERGRKRAVYKWEDKIALRDGGSLQTLAHETVHALSSHKLHAELGSRVSIRGEDYLKGLREQLKSGTNDKGGLISKPTLELIDLYLHVIDQGGAAKAIGSKVSSRSGDPTARAGFNYGLGNLDEFLTQAFTSTQFQRELASINVERAGQSAWSSFIGIVQKILGFEPNKHNALTEILSISETLFKQQEIGRKLGDFSATEMPGARGASTSDPADFVPITRDALGEIEDLSLAGTAEQAQKGAAYWRKAADDVGAHLRKKDKELLDNLDASVAEDAFNPRIIRMAGAPNPGKQLTLLTKRIRDKARVLREKEVSPNIPQYIKEIADPDHKTTKPFVRESGDDVPDRIRAKSRVVGEIDGIEHRISRDDISATKDAVTEDEWLKMSPEEIVKRYMQEDAYGQRVFKGIKKDVKSGKRLNKELEKTDLKVEIEDAAGLFRRRGDEPPVTHPTDKAVKDIQGHELTFKNKEGEVVPFKDLPKDLQKEAERYLKANGGKVKGRAAEPDAAPARIKDDPDQLEMELKEGEAPTGPAAKRTKTVSREEVERRVQEFQNSLAKMDPEGGEQAILSAARTVRSDADFSVLVEAAARWRHESAVAQGTVTKVTADDLLKAGREIGDILGSGDKNALEAAVRAAERDAQDLSLIMARQMEIKRLNNVIAKDAHEKAKQALKADEDASAGDYDVLAAEAFESMNLLLASQRAWSLFGHNLGLALKQRDFSYKALGQKTKDLKTSRTALAAFRDESTGSMSEKKLLRLMAMSNDESSMVSAINRHVSKTKGSKLFNMVREYWVNSLLSGPATQVVNLLGSLLTYSLRSVERTAGAVATGDFELARATIQYSFNVESIADAFKLAGQALKSGEAVTLQNSRVFDDVRNSRKAISSDDDNAFGAAINFMGEAVRLPSRGLLAGDELFKALSYRTYIKTELATQGMKKGYRGNTLGSYVKNGMDAYITEGGRAFNEVNLVIDANRNADKAKVSFEKRDQFIEDYLEKVNPEVYQIDDGAGKMTNLSRDDRGALAERAAQWAKENTHTQDSQNSIVRNLSHTVAQNPLLTFVIPFIRTPTNLLSFGFARSPLALPLEGLRLISKDYRHKFMKGTAAEKADIRGRLATGVASTASLLWLLEATDASQFITGYGPREKTQRKAWEMNNQQYSLRVGDKWVAYNRADPAATMLGLLADFVEARRSGDFDDDEASDLFGALALSLANNVTNKSYVQGLDNLFNLLKDPTKNTQRFIGSIAGGFVPNLANQAMSFEEDRALRETRNLMDYLIRRTPAAGSIPPRRNFLGEVETMSSSGGLGGVLNPLYTKEILDDPVNAEFANLGQGFGKPGFYLRDGVKSLDMRDAVNENGDQAYDQLLKKMSTQKIGGKTLRGRLDKLFASKAYQRLPDTNLQAETGTESRKVSSIRRLIRAYKTKARYEMLKEFPELNQKYKEVRLAARNR